MSKTLMYRGAVYREAATKRELFRQYCTQWGKVGIASGSSGTRQEARDPLAGQDNPSVAKGRRGWFIVFHVWREGMHFQLHWLGDDPDSYATGFKRSDYSSPKWYKTEQEAKADLKTAVNFIKRWRSGDEEFLRHRKNTMNLRESNSLLAEIRRASGITVKPKRQNPGYYTGSASTVIDGVLETVSFEVFAFMSSYFGGRPRREWLANVFKKGDLSQRDFIGMDPVGSYREALAELKDSLDRGWETVPGLGLCAAPSKHDQ